LLINQFECVTPKSFQVDGKRHLPNKGLTNMNAFTDQLAEWQVFYSTVALASVTLAGLLFVSLSINREAVRGGGQGLSLRLARESFGDFCTS
jgi:hypothetical protein